MTEYIEQTSASDRYEAARKALAEYEKWADHAYAFDIAGEVLDLADALRALITPPSVGESEHDMAMRIADAYNPPSRGTAYEAATRGIRAGIQYAHERWEPSDRPSQEQMLRWLGIEYAESDDGERLIILSETIDREEI